MGLCTGKYNIIVNQTIYYKKITVILLSGVQKDGYGELGVIIPRNSIQIQQLCLFI